MEGVALLERTVGQLNRLVDNVKPDQLDKSTLCTEWKVRDLLNHLAGGGTMFAVSAETGSVTDELMGQLMTQDQLGDDYKGAVQGAARRVLTAYEQPGVMEKTVTLPFGQMPAGVALNIAVFDVATHCCDLARATGQTVDDAELLETALIIGRQMIGPDLRQPGVFAAERSVSDGASAADRLLGFAGRSV